MIEKSIQLDIYSGLNTYLCRKVFRRLYDDALRRIERKQERAKLLLKEKADNLAKAYAAQVEFTDTDCAFLRIRPLVPPTHQLQLHQMQNIQALMGGGRPATAPDGLVGLGTPQKKQRVLV